MDVNMVVLWHDTEETAYSHHHSARRTRPGSNTAYQGTERVSIGHRSNSPCPTRDSQARDARATPPNKDSAFLPSRERRRDSWLGFVIFSLNIFNVVLFNYDT